MLCKRDGSRYGRRTRGFNAAATRAGLKDLRWHDLRRTCGCRLLQDHGLTFHEVRDWLVHESVAQTERAYAFLKVDALRAAVESRTNPGTGVADNKKGRATNDG